MDIEVTVTVIHAEVIPDHITDATTEALHDIITQALIATAVTCHTGDHHHIEAGPDHACHINQVKTTHPVPAGQQ